MTKKAVLKRQPFLGMVTPERCYGTLLERGYGTLLYRKNFSIAEECPLLQLRNVPYCD
jgi:hypothetical protein